MPMSHQTIAANVSDLMLGLFADAEFAVDSKCHPVPLEKAANDKR